jgi:hypothetical protein
MKRHPVIVTDRGAEVCQKCLVKWARYRNADKLFRCKACLEKEKK